jgi:hypothetical protein
VLTFIIAHYYLISSPLTFRLLFSSSLVPFYLTMSCFVLPYLILPSLVSLHFTFPHYISFHLCCFVSYLLLTSHRILSCPALPCAALSCPALPCLVLSCLVLSCLTWPTRLPRDDDIGLEIIKTINGAYSSAVQ